jgi:uncharacterized protein (TIGR02284 family)
MKEETDHIQIKPFIIEEMEKPKNESNPTKNESTMNKEKSIEVLNSLIEINNDRIAGYETASKETEESDLKKIFPELKRTSERCNSELIGEVANLGGTPTTETRTSGKMYRVWMDVKSAITGKDRKALLNSCEFGEDIAVDTYRKVLRDNAQDITAHQQTLLNAQFSQIKADHDHIRRLRDALLDKK